MVLTIIIFILVLFITVIAHEWGHFIAAKKSGMMVEEFGFGMLWKLYSWKRGETVYSINALPIGGFVKIAGENGLDNNIPHSRQFESKPWYLQSIVLVAGVVCNVILAIILFTTAYTLGMPTAVKSGGTPTIVQVVQGSAAEASGIAVGDTVQSVTIGGKEIPAIDTETLHTAIIESTGDVLISYTHHSEHHTTTLTPKGTGGERKIGLAIESILYQKQPFGTALHNAVIQSGTLAVGIFHTLGSLVSGIFVHNDTAGSLIGPVGLAHEVGSAASIGFTYLLAFTAMISINLAVLNIMPFPALDGGRLVVVLLEAITRKKFSAKTVGWIHAVGFLILLGLMLYLTIGDIGRLL